MIFVTPVKYCLVVLIAFLLGCSLEKPPRGGTRQRSSFSAIINKRNRDCVSVKRPKRDRKQQQKSELDRRLRSICTKLDEGNVNAGIRMAVGDDKVAGFHVDNYAALKLKYPQRETCSVPDSTDIVFQPRSFSSTRLSFPSPMALVQGWMAFRTKF